MTAATTCADEADLVEERGSSGMRDLGIRTSMRLAIQFGFVASAMIPQPVFAWGYTGHETIAALARSYLTPAVKAKVDRMLAADGDTLTRPDMLSRATWADAWRGAGHRETAKWHFIDIELDKPDQNAACFGHPAFTDPASAGASQDCIVDKIQHFRTELAGPRTSAAERVLALKYVMHFVGDVHQPLHASDNHDRGGNCVLLLLGGVRTVNLHTYWDKIAVEELGRDPEVLAARLRAAVSSQSLATWSRGSAADWAAESYGISKTWVYAIRTKAGCDRDSVPVPVPAGYDETARRIVATQMEKAGFRLAMTLNRALQSVEFKPEPAAVAPNGARGSGIRRPLSPQLSGRSASSVKCSAQADAHDLHGRERQAFRRRCMR